MIERDGEAVTHTDLPKARTSLVNMPAMSSDPVPLTLRAEDIDLFSMAILSHSSRDAFTIISTTPRLLLLPENRAVRSVNTYRLAYSDDLPDPLIFPAVCLLTRLRPCAVWDTPSPNGSSQLQPSKWSPVTPMPEVRYCMILQL